MDRPLMPKATAVWLVENTSLSFEQIAAFCGLHPLEVQGIADGDVAQGIKGLDPVASGQLTRESIEEAEADHAKHLVLAKRRVEVTKPKRRGPRYTPLSKRQDRPDAIMWLLRYHPELTDAQISKLVGTTKPTIQLIRDRSHWNMQNIKPVDPVTLGLCSQTELDQAVRKAAAKRAKEQGTTQESGATLLPADETTAPTVSPLYEPRQPSAPHEPQSEDAPAKEKQRVYHADEVFARLKPAPQDAESESDAETNKVSESSDKD